MNYYTTDLEDVTWNNFWSFDLNFEEKNVNAAKNIHFRIGIERPIPISIHVAKLKVHFELK